jgi:hypothetical protein
MNTPTTTLDLPLATNGLVVGFGVKTQPPTGDSSPLDLPLRTKGLSVGVSAVKT